MLLATPNWGGVAPTLIDLIKQAHGYKCHWSVADYLQRAARHVASATDVEQAYAVGKAGGGVCRVGQKTR